MAALDRITTDPAIFGGKPIVRGMRISVDLILSLLAQGASQEAILDDYPGLEPEDIRACLAYAYAGFLVSATPERPFATQTAEVFFAGRKGRGDKDSAIRFLTRWSGEPPRPDDPLPNADDG